MKLPFQINESLGKACEIAITFILAWMTLVLVLHIVSRAIFDTGIPWTDEMARYTMIWLIFIGAALATKNKDQIRVTAIEEKFPSLRRFLTISQQIITLAYLSVVIWASWRTLKIVHTQISANMNIPMSYIYVSITVGAILMVIFTINQLAIKNTSNEEEGGNPA